MKTQCIFKWMTSLDFDFPGRNLATMKKSFLRILAFIMNQSPIEQNQSNRYTKKKERYIATKAPTTLIHLERKNS